jgi:hypothetical protein
MSDENDLAGARFAIQLRWIARLTGLVSIGFMGVLVIRERMNPLQMRIEDLLLFLCFPTAVTAGLLAGWRWEFAGGLIAVVGFVAYYGAHHFLVGNLPSGWVFTGCTLPGVLFLWSGLLARLRARRRGSSGSAGASSA